MTIVLISKLNLIFYLFYIFSNFSRSQFKKSKNIYIYCFCDLKIHVKMLRIKFQMCHTNIYNVNKFL